MDQEATTPTAEDRTLTEVEPSGSLLARYGIDDQHAAPVLPATRSLDLVASEQVLLYVARIDRAEKFYHEFFEMDVVLRAWRTQDGWDRVTEPVDWESMLINGHFPELSLLRRDEFTILLVCAGRGYIFNSPVSQHADVSVSPSSMQRLRGRALIKGYTVVTDTTEEFAFRDPFRVIWHLHVSSDDETE